MFLRRFSRVNVSMVLTREFIYTQLYKITSKYYFKTYLNGSDESRTRVLLPVCLMPTSYNVYMYYIYIYMFNMINI